MRNEIEKHNKAYYEKDTPIISDTEYDELFRDLKKLEAAYPEFVSPESPTQRVGAVVNSDLKEHKHKYRLYSLDNSNNYEDLRKTYERIKKEYPTEAVELVTELKIDGLAVALSYERGKLVTGATRGDGITGEIITENIKQIKSIPQKLKHEINIEVRGEVYMPVSSFEKLNEEQRNGTGKEFANPRNAAAGSLRQQNPEITGERDLCFFAYAAVFPDGKTPGTHYEILKLLSEEGFDVNDHSKIQPDMKSVERYCKYWEAERFKLNYATDGIVVKVNDITKQNELGYTARAPKWATAFKFPPEEIETELTGIELGVGKTGVITPVAILMPVRLAGTVVKRASLHNFDEIERLNINIGDRVLIKKAAEIIPKVIRKARGNNGTYKAANNCPSCGTRLIKPEGEVNLYCPNTSGCPAQITGRAEYWCSKEAADIDGLGESIIEQCTKKGYIKDIADIYALTEDKLTTIDLIREKSAQNIMNSIEKSKRIPLKRFITGLSIKLTGKETADLLANELLTLEAIQNATKEQLTTIPGIGEKVAEEIVKFFGEKENQYILKKFKEFGVEVLNAKSDKISDIFKDKTFVITGTLSKPRNEFESIIKSHGGKLSSTVSKKTSYVLAGINPGSKFDKASSLGVIILDETEFNKLIEE